MSVTGQRLVSHSRIERLTEQEMKQLLRLLSTELRLDYVRFLHRGPTVAVDLVGYTGSIPPQVLAVVTQMLGDFDVVEPPPLD